MFFQNSLTDRSVGEDPGNKREGVENKYSIPKGIGKNWKQERNPTRVISSDPRGLGAKLHSYIPRNKNSTQRKLSEKLKRNWVQWWHLEKLKAYKKKKQLWNIHNFSEKTKEWYVIVKGSWFLRNFLFKTTFYRSRQGWHIWLVRSLRWARSRLRSLFQLLSRSM